MTKKIMIHIYGLFFLFLVITIPKSYASDPKLVSTLNNAFQKIESYIIKLSTRANCNYRSDLIIIINIFL